MEKFNSLILKAQVLAYISKQKRSNGGAIFVILFEHIDMNEQNKSRLEIKNLLLWAVRYSLWENLIDCLESYTGEFNAYPGNSTS